MVLKKYYFEDVGEVIISKRKKVKKISLKVIGGTVKVTQPSWLPYLTGKNFVVQNKKWIINQKKIEPKIIIEEGQRVGKDHIINIKISDKNGYSVKNHKIILFVKDKLNSDSRQLHKNYKIALKKALKIEANKYLPSRLERIASNYNIGYNRLALKAMRSRWGSCNSKKCITLNVYLMLTPWDLIDYVIVHELVHTQYLNHSNDFWLMVSDIIPDFKERKARLRDIQKKLSPLYSS